MPAPSHAALPPEGSMRRADHVGTAVVVARVGGALYAFQDECTHRGCSLAEGQLVGRHVVCPCHGGTFDVTTGAVVSGPPRTALRTWRVTTGTTGVELTG